MATNPFVAHKRTARNPTLGNKLQEMTIWALQAPPVNVCLTSAVKQVCALVCLGTLLGANSFDFIHILSPKIRFFESRSSRLFLRIG
jgi:hypothetical protein